MAGAFSNQTASHRTQMNAVASREMEPAEGHRSLPLFPGLPSVTISKPSFDRQSCTSIETQEARHFISKQPARGEKPSSSGRAHGAGRLVMDHHFHSDRVPAKESNGFNAIAINR